MSAADRDPARAAVDSRGGSLSVLLIQLAQDEGRTRISAADLVRRLEGRAFGALLLIFALPNIVPNIPGTSAILAIPLIFLSAQMMLGRPPLLPRAIGERSLARDDFAAMIRRIGPALARAERLLKPRLGRLTGRVMQRWLGALCLLLSLILLLPVPLGNILPGLSISVIALGMLGRDGLWVLIGLAVSVLSLLVVAVLTWALIRAGAFLLANIIA